MNSNSVIGVSGALLSSDRKQWAQSGIRKTAGAHAQPGQSKSAAVDFQEDGVGVKVPPALSARFCHSGTLTRVGDRRSQLPGLCHVGSAPTYFLPLGKEVIITTARGCCEGKSRVYVNPECLAHGGTPWMVSLFTTKDSGHNDCRRSTLPLGRWGPPM